jgi:hypothetical protein
MAVAARRAILRAGAGKEDAQRDSAGTALHDGFVDAVNAVAGRVKACREGLRLAAARRLLEGSE